MKTLFVLVLGLLLAGCNAQIGIPEDIGEQPWRTVYLVSFAFICVIPIISLVILIIARLGKPAFVKKSYQLFLYSVALFVLMLGSWLILEMSLPKDVNIRVDLFIVLPAVLAQVVIIAISRFFMLKRRVANFDK